MDKKTIYNFYELDYPQRLKILLELSIIEHDDETLDWLVQSKSWEERIKNRGLVEQFKKLIQAATNSKF